MEENKNLHNQLAAQETKHQQLYTQRQSKMSDYLVSHTGVDETEFGKWFHNESCITE